MTMMPTVRRTLRWLLGPALLAGLGACATILGDDFEAACDGLDDCGDCWDCALDGDCADKLNACTSNEDCAAIIQCSIACGNAFEEGSEEHGACLFECENRPIWMHGRPAYLVLVECVDCSCQDSCDIPSGTCS